MMEGWMIVGRVDVGGSLTTVDSCLRSIARIAARRLDADQASVEFIEANDPIETPMDTNELECSAGEFSE
jgi:hypothetical protein